jgi:Skp family chaperone for outer membrane proteins
MPMFLTAVCVAIPALGFAATARAELQVGVVDIIQVMNRYARTEDANSELKLDLARLESTTKPKYDKIEELRNQRDGFNKGTEEWERLDEQAMKAEIELRTEMAYEQARIEKRHIETLHDLYRDIKGAVAWVARREKIDLVFTRAWLEPPRIDMEEARGLEDLKGRIVGQRLIYPGEPTDVTKAVIEKLNRDYDSAKPRGEGPRG